MNNILFDRIVLSLEINKDAGDIIGYSRKGNPIRAFKLGKGSLPISLVGGLYAEAPLGPRFLRQFTSFLLSLPSEHVLMKKYQWWIIPHANPDGELLNLNWTSQANGYYHLSHYLLNSVSDTINDDMEHGFPVDDDDKGARPENKAIYRWWETCEHPFGLHISFHGMAYGQGPRYLIDPSWITRCRPLIDICSVMTNAMGYTLHDEEYKGEKGMVRICRGFGTPPETGALKDWYHDHGVSEENTTIRPSSMQVIRKLSGDCLTLVPDLPLFIIPDNNNGSLFNRNKWDEQFGIWRKDKNKSRIERQAGNMQIRPMKVYDQMRLLFELLRAGILLAENN